MIATMYFFIGVCNLQIFFEFLSKRLRQGAENGKINKKKEFGSEYRHAIDKIWEDYMEGSVHANTSENLMLTGEAPSREHNPDIII